MTSLDDGFYDDASSMKLSIIIPALNEAEQIGATLDSTRRGQAFERIVVDGGSQDHTRDIVRRRGVQLVSSPRGRGRQLCRGVKRAQGDTYLFLHGDTRLPDQYHRSVRQVLSAQGISAGAFQLEIDGDRVGHRFIEKLVQFRSRVFQMPYGDQGLFVRRRTYERAGGFPNVPIMEDVRLVRRLRHIGRVGIAQGAVKTSARRWQERGTFRTTLINQVMMGAFYLGVSPHTLWKWYYQDHVS